VQIDKDLPSPDFIMVVVFGMFMCACSSKIQNIEWSYTGSIRRRCRKQRKAELDDARRDLELRKVAWGQTEGGDGSELC
jgi:hypothetical protein